MSDLPLTHDAIHGHLRAVAELLDAEGRHATWIVVGGSYLALRRMRESTVDVDIVTNLDERDHDAVRRVAQANGLPPDWLNDNARGFHPQGLRQQDCDVLFEAPGLTVLGPPPDMIFLMKLQSARTRDIPDLVALWPKCRFQTASDVVRQYEQAYPHDAGRDPHLDQFVQQIIDRATRP